MIPVFGEEMKHMNKPVSSSSRGGGSLIRTRLVSREGIGHGVRLPVGFFAVLFAACACLVFAPVAFAAPSRAYESSFGSLSEPEAVTVDQSTGDVYVVDTGAGTVSRFSSTGAPVEFSATKSNVLSGFVFESNAAQVAVAPAGSPGGTAGDIYVVSSLTDNVAIFDSNGNHVGELNGSGNPDKGFGEPCGVATEASTGAVYVGEYSNHHVWRYTPTTGTVTEADYTGGIETPMEVCNVAAGGGFVYAGNTYGGGELLKYQASAFVPGAPPAPSGTLLDATATAVATDPSNGDVYVDEGERVSVFNSSGTSLYTFGSSTDFGSNSAGVGVMGNNGKAFVADRTAGQVDVFATAANLPPVATTNPASTIHHTDAVLNGHLAPGTDPGGATDPITACRFDWGTDTKYTGGTVPCNEGNSFTTAANVTANLGHLTPGMLIHYRLRIASAASGEATGGDETFTPPPFPLVHPVLATFGAAGSGAGQFSGLRNLALNQSTGDVYVADTGNHRVERFLADGTFVSAFGWGVSDGTAAAQVCTSGCQAGISGSGTGQFNTPVFVAIDNSGGASQGDVYVADTGTNLVQKFDATGKPITTWGGTPAPGQLNGSSSPNGPFGSTESALGEHAIGGIAVDGTGHLDVFDASTRMFQFDENGSLLGEFTTARGSRSKGLAIDNTGNFFKSNGNESVEMFGPTGTDLGQVTSGFSSQAFAVNPASDDLYVASSKAAGEPHPHSIERFSFDGAGRVIQADGTTCTPHIGEPFSGCSPTESFGSADLTEPVGVAVRGSDGRAYVADTASNTIRIFGVQTLEVPTVTLATPTAITGSLATLHAKVDPEGVNVTDCHFDYGTTTAYGQSAPCSPMPGSGSGDVAVSAALSGLQPGAVYHFRIVAVNANGASAGGDQAFTALSTVLTEAASNVGVSEATLNGSVNPEEVAVTSCEFEYGMSTSYGKTAPCATDPGTDNAQTPVSATITGLQLTTTYHYRLRSSSGGGEGHGADLTFTTVSPRDFVGAGLPDGRVYELVTNPDSGDAEVEVYEPEASVYSTQAGVAYSSIATEFPFQASVDGGAVAFAGSPSVGGNEDAGEESGNEYVARRSGDGSWKQTNISPAGFPSGVFEGFSDDLSVGFLDSLEPMAPGVPGFGEPTPQGGNYDILYSASTAADGRHVPLITTLPPYRSRLEFGTFGVGHESLPKGVRQSNSRVLMYAGASADSSHVLFQANDALTPEAEGGSAAHYNAENNLYEYTDGQLRLVNVLPDHSTKANATFGAPNFEKGGGTGAYASPDFSHVISNDGSRIFWTDLNTGHIYVRENGTTTVEISSGGKYWTATPDGSKVFYTNGDLYEYDVETGHTTDLTPGVTVQGVIGTSEDGIYVYYVTAGVDLDLWHNGTTSTIKTLTAHDNGNSEGALNPYGAFFAGDLKPGYGNRMAEVSPDGHGVVFMSTNGEEGEQGKNTGRVDVYDADNGQLYCASCGSPGSQGFVPLTFSNTYLKRWISNDGSRVFFDSKEALVPQDSNGKLDVYEWERPGSGTCKASTTGCIYLLSGGTSGSESYLADASTNGNDVFVVTRAKLLSRDDNELYDLYDVRVGGSEPVSVPQCTGTGCQGLPGAPPIFATPSSVTFEGSGNFAAPAPAMKLKPKPKSKKKAKKKKPKPKHKTRHGGAKKGAKANSGHAGNGRNARRSSGKGGRS
jgi:DNA-binding beta-propeller fold protein YncE